MNCEPEFHDWFEEINHFADINNILVTIPRIASRHVRRANIPADSPDVYYRRNVMLPFLNHVTTEMENRFGSIHLTKKISRFILSTTLSYASSSMKDVGEHFKS